jgi:hypothetical protein
MRAKESFMAMSRNMGTIVIVLLVGILLAVLNPSQADFKAHLASAGSASVSKSGGAGGLGGVLSKGAAALAGGVGSLASGLYQRRDYIVFSSFTAPGAGGSVYLGIAKLFIRLK